MHMAGSIGASFGAGSAGAGMTSGTQNYGTSGVGFDMPAGSTVVGWKKTGWGSLSRELSPVWVAPAPAAAAPVTNFNVSSNPTVIVPTTTQTTTAVSPVLNVAAGSTGVTQGATTGQQATPTSGNTTPTNSPATQGMTSDMVQKLLEQRERELQTLASEQAKIAAERAAMASERKDAELAAEKQRYELLLKQAQQQQAVPAVQQSGGQLLPAGSPSGMSPNVATLVAQSTEGDAVTIPGKVPNQTATIDKAASSGVGLLAIGAIVAGLLLTKKRGQKRQVKNGR